MADRIGKLFKSVSNNLVPIAAIVVVMMLIIPLPTWLLDVLMAGNLLLALLMLLIVIYTPRAIDFSSFPSMLLISTVGTNNKA